MFACKIHPDKNSTTIILALFRQTHYIFIGLKINQTCTSGACALNRLFNSFVWRCYSGISRRPTSSWPARTTASARNDGGESRVQDTTSQAAAAAAGAVVGCVTAVTVCERVWLQRGAGQLLSADRWENYLEDGTTALSTPGRWSGGCRFCAPSTLHQYEGQI